MSPPEAEVAHALPLTALNQQLMAALTALRQAGEADLACRIAARAWSLLRRSSPEEALKLEKLLHRLTRPIPQTQSANPKGNIMTETAIPLEVRHLPPAERHALILETCGKLALGGAIDLINDHDPKPLRYQFDAETPGEFRFTYLESGPTVWRVRIERIAEPARATSGGPAVSETLIIDVRRILPRDRHTQIFAAYERLPAGGAFELVNDHDPKPLYYQFQAQHGGHFRWDYLEQGPAVWRVRIGRAA